METAVLGAVGSLDDEPRNQGAVKLAIEYARAIDEGGELVKLGQGLLSALDALLLTPRARREAVARAEPVRLASSPLDRLREKRNDRLRAAGE